jgi:hypothetical protein
MCSWRIGMHLTLGNGESRNDSEPSQRYSSQFFDSHFRGVLVLDTRRWSLSRVFVLLYQPFAEPEVVTAEK